MHPSNTWTDFYGEIIVSGEPVAIGACVVAYIEVVTLRSVGSILKVGEFKVTKPGRYGTMHVYGDDPATPEDEGTAEGDVISFTINGYPAVVVRGDPPWANRTVREVDLAAVSLGNRAYLPLVWRLYSGGW